MPTFNTDSKFDIQLSKAEMEERGLADLLMNGKIEMKTEHFQWWKHGNAFIETGCDGKPSGLLTTEAGTWAHQLRREDELVCTLFWPVPMLKRIVKSCAERGFIRGCGDGDRFSGVRVPLGPIRLWGA